MKRKTQLCERLENKCELLMDAERKLMERVEQLESSEDLAKSGDSGTGDKDNQALRKRIHELEEQVSDASL